MEHNRLYEALINNPCDVLSLKIQKDLTDKERTDLISYCEYKIYKINNLVENVLKFRPRIEKEENN